VSSHFDLPTFRPFDKLRVRIVPVAENAGGVCRTPEVPVSVSKPSTSDPHLNPLLEGEEVKQPAENAGGSAD